MPQITSLYGQDPDREWARLDQDPFQRLEYDPTLRFLTPVLSPAARVPDGLEAHLALARSHRRHQWASHDRLRGQGDVMA